MPCPGVVLPKQVHPFHNIAPAAGGRAAVYTDTFCGDEPAGEGLADGPREGGAGQPGMEAAVAHTSNERLVAGSRRRERSDHTYKCVWPTKWSWPDCWFYHRCDRSQRRSNARRGECDRRGSKRFWWVRGTAGPGGTRYRLLPGPFMRKSPLSGFLALTRRKHMRYRHLGSRYEV